MSRMAIVCVGKAGYKIFCPPFFASWRVYPVETSPLFPLLSLLLRIQYCVEPPSAPKLFCTNGCRVYSSNSVYFGRCPFGGAWWFPAKKRQTNGLTTSR